MQKKSVSSRRHLSKIDLSDLEAHPETKKLLEIQERLGIGIDPAKLKDQAEKEETAYSQESRVSRPGVFWRK